jgi:hypothetical protein
MNETLWAVCDHPRDMLLALRQHKASPRKLRLFFCACVRGVAVLIEDDRGLEALEIAEVASDGRASKADLEAAARVADDLHHSEQITTTTHPARWYAREALARLVSLPPGKGVHATVWEAVAHGPTWVEAPFGERSATAEHLRAEEAKRQADLLRDLFGNPYRPAFVDPVWLTPQVRSLARGAYEERLLPSGRLDPARLAVLSDALEDAGASEEMVEHLRGPGPHWRGCWAVDRVLAWE